jgi:predicted O-methyltransferase YrrM
MSFSSNWFDNLAKDNFEKLIKPLFQDKQMKYLEIGCFEGASLNFMFNNIMTENSTATVIDPFIFYNNQLDVFTNNMKKYSHRFDLIIGYSENVLRTLKENDYDFIYIDGDHTSKGVFNDAILSFPLLKPGGIIIFDDYLWRYNEEHTITGLDNINLNHPNNPFSGINKFLSIYDDKIEIIKSNWQMIIKKI